MNNNETSESRLKILEQIAAIPIGDDPDLALMCLDGADFFAQREGLIGIRPILYYRILEYQAQKQQNPQIWTRLFQTAKEGRQIPIAIRALSKHACRYAQENDDDTPQAWMSLGHYFRFAAGQYSESARAYAKAAKPEQTDAICALLALQRLYRHAPDCDDAARAIDYIRQQGLVPTQSKDNLESQLGKIDPNDTNARTHALIELAKVMITEFGNASRALDWLEAAYALKADPVRLTPVCHAIACAIPDNTPILTRTLELLIKCRAWHSIDKIARLITCMDFVPADFEPMEMTLAMVYALQLNNEQRAAEELFNAALRNPNQWVKDIQQRAWICIYAAEHDIFRRSLFEAMTLVNNQNLNSTIIAFYEKFSRTPKLRKSAIFMRINQYLQENDFTNIFKVIQQCITNDMTANDPDFYEILRDIIIYDDDIKSTEHNLKILDTSLKLFEVDHNQATSLRFIEDFIDIFSRKPNSENYHKLYKKALDIRLLVDPLNTYTVSDHFPELDIQTDAKVLKEPSVNVTEIIKNIGKKSTNIRPTELTDEEDLSISMEFEPEFNSSLTSLNTLDTLLSKPSNPQIPKSADKISLESLSQESIENPPDTDPCQEFFDNLHTQDLTDDEKITKLVQFDNTRNGLNLTDNTLEQTSLRWQMFYLLLHPQDQDIAQQILANIHPTNAQWMDVATHMLQYLNYIDPKETVCDTVVQICANHLQKRDAFDLLFGHFNLCLQHDVLFEQVLRMSDNTNQKQQMMEKMDDAIAVFAGDINQRNALFIKKYKLAEILGDERIRMSCLKEILETTPDNAFALTELKNLNPDKLSHHAQILYYQLRIYTENHPNQKLALQQHLVTLYMQSSQINNAINLYHTMIDDHPDYLNARYQLIDLLVSQENWKAAENVLLALINVEPSNENRYQCLIRLAGIQNDKLMVSSRALLTLFAALDTDPYRINLLHPEMCKISEQLRSFSPLIDKYEEIIHHHSSQEIRRTIVMHLAHVYNDYLKKPTMACNVLDDFYRQGGAADPEFLRCSARFYGDLKHWNGYVRTIAQLIPQIQDNRERVQLALAAAHVYAENLGDHAHAAQVALVAANSQPQTAAQWLEIADFLLAGEFMPQAILALENSVALETDPSKKIQLYLELARQYAMVDDIEHATESFHTALQFNPNLEQITPIAEELIAHATASRNKDAFIVLCHDLISSSPATEQTSLLLQQALTLIRVYHDSDAARKIIDDNTDRMTAIDLDQSLILAQILTLLHENAPAIQLLQSIMKRFPIDDEQQQTCLKMLLSNASALNDYATVQITANAILKRSPKDADARFYLIQLDHQSGRWDQAAAEIQDLLPDIEQLSPDNAMLIHYYYGEILHASQHDGLAIECLDNALRIRLDYRPAVDLKLTILLENQRWPEALPIFNLLLELTNDPDEKGAIHKRIAEIHHFYMHDKERAIREYEYAITLGGDVEDVPVRLLQLYVDTKRWRNAAVTAQVLAQAQIDSPNARCDYLIALGKIQFKHLEEYQEALKTFSEAFEIQPLDPEILQPLAQLHVRNQNWQDFDALVDTLAKQLDNNKDQATDRLFWIAQKCGKIESCIPALERAQAALNQHNIDVRLLAHAEEPDPEWLTPLTPHQPRHRTNTQPGNASYDSDPIENSESTSVENPVTSTIESLETYTIENSETENAEAENSETTSMDNPETSTQEQPSDNNSD